MSTVLTTPFGEQSTAEEVSAGLDLTGLRALVTGAASGIGAETARVLALRGAAVTLAVRDVAAGRAVAGAIDAATPGPAPVVERLDLADLDSVRGLVDRWDGPLHVLVANAGVMALPELRRTPAGHELQLATNHIGHVALATGLRPALAAEGARVVVLSSTAHLFSPVLFDDPAFAFVPYGPFLAYGQSKTANALFAVEADRRWARDGVRVNAVMPGGIATGLQRHVDPEALAAARRAAGAGALKTVAQGAATSVLAAVSPLLEGIGGRYLEDCGEAPLVPSRAASDGRHGVAAYALDPGNAGRLWDVSERWVAGGPPLPAR